MVDVMPSSVDDEYARIDLGAQFDDEDHVAASAAAIGPTIASTSVSVGKIFMSLLCCCWLLVDLKRRRRELCVITFIEYRAVERNWIQGGIESATSTIDR